MAQRGMASLSSSRRAALLAAAAASAALALPRAARAAWPERPVRWLVGYPAGGGTDVLARMVGAAMTARLGVPVVVENRPGAATNLAAEAAANAPPDGYTVFTAGNETLVFNPALYRRLPFDADNGLRPLGLMARFHLVLCAKPNGGAVDAAGFIERARARAGAMDYGSPGIGSPHHLATERLARDLGVRLNHVPYRGMAPVMNDLMGGHIALGIVDPPSAITAIEGKKVAAIAISSPQRFAPMPDIPTFAESLPGFESLGWFGIVAPAKTPADIVAKLQADVMRAATSPEGKQKIEDAGFRVTGTNGAEFGRIIAADTVTWGKAVAATGFKAD